MVATDQKTQHNKKTSPMLISIFVRNLPEPLNFKPFIIWIEKQRFKNRPNNCEKKKERKRKKGRKKENRIIHMMLLIKREWSPTEGKTSDN